METKQMKFRSDTLITMILMLTLARIISPFFIGIPNFSPVDAMALFCGAYFFRRMAACGVLILSVWLGDVLVNRLYFDHWTFFYAGCFWQYSAYLIMVWMGSSMANRISMQRVAMAACSAALLFFIISNLGVWLTSALYPQTSTGLVACYVAALPFLKYTLISDLLFAGILFGAVAFMRKHLPAWIQQETNLQSC